MRPPHWRGRGRRNFDSLTLTIEASASRVFRKQRQCPRSRVTILQNLDRPPPRQFLRIANLAQIHMPLHHMPVGDPRVLDDAPAAMVLAILPADFAAQEHDGRQLSAH
jgi:hypothetical protein